MTRLFDERERAAENFFVHDAELSFLARRRGVQATAKWAAESMGLNPDVAAAYETKILDAFIGGASEAELTQTIATDLEQAGKPTMSPLVAAQLAQAIAEAGLSDRGKKGPIPAEGSASPREEWARHHPTHDPSWSWGR